MTRIGLHGAAGQMGVMLARAITQSDKCELAGGCDRAGSPSIGEDLGLLAGMAPLGLQLTDDAAALCAAADVVVDYSAASATMHMLPTAISQRKPVVVGTTGFDDTQHAKLAEAGRQIPIMLAANMSVSVMAMYELVRTASRLLGDEFDIEIFDFHPRTKIDAPSGTAIELLVRTGRRRRLREHRVLRRGRPAPRDHEPGDRLRCLRLVDARCRCLDRPPAARLLHVGRYAERPGLTVAARPKRPP